jgi:6-phosphofructokinase 2
MSHIITITFSPCVDKSTAVSSLIPEKKMKCTAPKLEPGGGGINVARVIKKLGGTATAIFPSGGYTGKFLNHLMNIEEVPFTHIQIKNETRENVIVLDESTNKQYRFGMPSAALLETEWQQCLHAVEKIKDIGYIIVSGSLPLGVPINIYAQISKITKKKNAKLIIDTSGAALRAAYKETVYLLKPNMAELCTLAGKALLHENEVEENAKLIIAKGDCEILIISMGEKGAMLVTKDITETIKPPQVKRKSTVGAGDSMVAGIVYYLSEGKSIVEAAKYGVACGTAATINTGTELCKKTDADKLYKTISNEVMEAV